jgi:hypothetical protein
MIKQSELRQAYLSGDSVSMLRNGRLGMVDRFTIYISNLLPNNTSDSTNCPARTGRAGGTPVRQRARGTAKDEPRARPPDPRLENHQ